tara:strand:+ start:96 stop:704 length:609 start_codon:yes stop_codon:yes gene_type:complete
MTENGKVTIVQDENGSVIRVSKNNPEFGHVRLTQEKVAFGAQGWVNKKVRSTLIHGTVEDLQSIGIADKTELPGHIVIREQLEAFSDTNPDRDLKIAGDTQIVCCKMGEPIYRKTFYSLDLDEGDTLVAHTNGDAIREANGTETKKTTISKEMLEEMTSPNDDEEKSTRRNKKSDNQVDIEDSIEEIEQEEVVEVEDASFEL